MDGHLTKEIKWVANRHMKKKSLTSLAIREMQIISEMQLHF